MVFHRRAGQRDPRLGLQRLGRLGLPGGGVLDRLRLVQDDEAPRRRRQRRHAQQRAVAGDRQVDTSVAALNCLIWSAAIAEGCTIAAFRSGREFLDLGRPVAQQRGRRHQQVRLAGGSLHQQQRQHLDGLSQAHVVGQAGAEAETGQQVHPSRAGALVGAQRSVQRGSGIGAVAVPGPQRLQGFLQPGAGGDAGPVGVVAAGSSPVTRRAGQHPHRLGEAQAVPGGKRLGLAEPVHGLFEAGAIDLDPLAAQQHQVVGAGEQGRDLVLGRAVRHRGSRPSGNRARLPARGRTACDCRPWR